MYRCVALLTVACVGADDAANLVQRMLHASRTQKVSNATACSDENTEFNQTVEGNVVYIDRHDPRCTSQKVMSQWKLLSSAANSGDIRINYKCCSISTEMGSCTEHNTDYAEESNGNVIFLDRHNVNCGDNNHVLTQWKVSRDDAYTKMRVDYTCCDVPTGLDSCHTMVTDGDQVENGHLFYLDRHNLICPTDEVMKRWQLLPHSSGLHFAYDCCKVTPTPHMSCGNAEKGFVNHGDPITGWIKSCPINLPFNNQSLQCATTECLVDPDRYTCCTQNICSCENGVAATGTSCGNHLEEDCQDCNSGYHLSADAGPGAQTCVEHLCVCPDGTPTTGTGTGKYLCAEEGSTDCSGCNAGFTINETAGNGSQICLPNICTCPDGTATTSSGSGPTLCETNNTVDCEKCDDYFQIELYTYAGLDLQQCVPKPCAKSLPQGNQYEKSECNGDIYEGNSCFIGCADGLYGTATKYTCSNGTLAGDPPECINITCNGVMAGPLLTAHTTSDCSIEQPTNTCEAHCMAGYMGDSQTYTCQEDGNFTPYTPMNCTPWWCNASHQPANGNNGSCTDDLLSGENCHIECDDNYTRHGGPTSCLAGTLQVVETCKPDPCDASVPPDNGAVGDCNNSLPSGATCTPECHDGYFLEGITSCYVGASPDNMKVLTEAICVPYCKCELIYLKQCVEQYGYWTEEQQYLDYPGCERFCNEMNLGQGINIYGCELENVSGEARSTKGQWCFAHLNQCDYGEDLPNNAAAKCIRFTSQGYVD